MNTLLSSVELVQGQLDAYNRRDLETFISFYSHEIEMYSLPMGEPRVIGFKKFRELYRDFFQKNQKIHCELVSRIVEGMCVVDHEHITGLNERAAFKAIAIYYIENNKIKKVWFPQ